MRTNPYEAAIDVLLCLHHGPKSAQACAEYLGITQRAVGRIVAVLRDRGLIYVCDYVPPLVGHAPPIYATQPDLMPNQCSDAIPWSKRLPSERMQRRIAYYGEEAVEAFQAGLAARVYKARQAKK